MNNDKIKQAIALLQSCLETEKGEVKTFPIWRTIEIGNRGSAEAYLDAFERAGIRISDWATEILKKCSIANKQEKIDLVKVTVADLGFTEWARFDTIMARAKELGLELCPPEVGPALREQYTDQPSGEWLLIAMEPIADSDGGLNVFRVGHGVDDRWLSTRAAAAPASGGTPRTCGSSLVGKH